MSGDTSSVNTSNRDHYQYLPEQQTNQGETTIKTDRFVRSGNHIFNLNGMSQVLRDGRCYDNYPKIKVSYSTMRTEVFEFSQIGDAELLLERLLTALRPSPEKQQMTADNAAIKRAEILDYQNHTFKLDGISSAKFKKGCAEFFPEIEVIYASPERRVETFKFGCLNELDGRKAFDKLETALIP